MSIKMLLREEIQEKTEALKELEVGSDEYKAAVDSVAKLTDRYIEFEKLDSEIDDKREARQVETYLKKDQMKQDKKLTVWRTVVEVGLFVAQATVYYRAMKTSIKFEETGTITSSFGKASISSLTRIFKR